MDVCHGFISCLGTQPVPDELEVRLPCSIRTFGLPMVAKQVLLHISQTLRIFENEEFLLEEIFQEFADD